MTKSEHPRIDDDFIDPKQAVPWSKENPVNLSEDKICIVETVAGTHELARFVDGKWLSIRLSKDEPDYEVMYVIAWRETSGQEIARMSTHYFNCVRWQRRFETWSDGSQKWDEGDDDDE